MFNINLTPVVKNLLIINFGLFIISWLTLSNLGIDINQLLGLHYVGSSGFKVYQFVTYMFLHSYVSVYGGISLAHIFSNMFGLFMFGPQLERVWGPKRFLIFYMVTGIGAGFLNSGITYWEKYRAEEAAEQYLQNPDPVNFANYLREQYGDEAVRQKRPFLEKFNQYPEDESLIEATQEFVKESLEKSTGVTVGASGAIFGILIAFGMLFPNTELFLLFFPFPIKAKYFVMFYGLYEIYTGINRAQGDNVAHFAHIGGMIFGFILVKYWNNKRNSFY